MEAISYPLGFTARGTACGIKVTGKPDLGILISNPPAAAFAVFTRNKVRAAPVLHGQDLIRVGRPVSHVLVNSGNANACTGDVGIRDVRQTALWVEEGSQSQGQVFISSTGVIGVFLPMDKIKLGVRHLLDATREKEADFAEAILTTDTVRKESRKTLDFAGKEVRIGGVAKGSGMICPDMATMLAYVTTDIHLPDGYAARFSSIAEKSFNSISVDGDMSTNDTALLLSNGASGVEYAKLDAADQANFDSELEAVCRDLARKIVWDGEGATKFVEIRVEGAMSDAEARAMAKAVSLSPLVKTALFGCDPNWGRVIAAAGSAGGELVSERVDLDFCEVAVMREGRPCACDLEDLQERMTRREVAIRLDLKLGQGTWTYWTCDFSYDYVKINAAYRT